MKKLIYIVLTTLMFSACAVTKHQNSIIGEYYGQTQRMGSFVPPGEMKLSLKPDGKFELNWLNVDYSGIWENLNKNHILLKFDEITDLTIILRSGIISEREKKIQIINKDKITFDNNTLKRIK